MNWRNKIKEIRLLGDRGLVVRRLGNWDQSPNTQISKSLYPNYLISFLIVTAVILLFSGIVEAATYRMWYSANDGGPNWRILSVTRELAINIGQPGALDSGHAYSSTVLKEKKGYIMYYGGYDGTNWRILRATSEDGNNWIKEGVAFNLGSIGSFDSVHTVYPYLIKDGNLYKLYYTANDGGKHWRVGYADSEDGIIFKNRKLCLDVGVAGALDAEHLQSPVVLKQGGLYIMYYAGFGGNPSAWRILRATSTDGINWQKQGLALDRGGAGALDADNLLPGSIIFSEGLFKMWYWAQGSNWRILYATSKNGIDWQKQGLAQDLGPVRSLDSRALVVPSVVEETK